MSATHRYPSGAVQCPIETLHQALLGLRAICHEMETLAVAAPPQPGPAQRIRTALRRDLPRILADERESLLPRLSARATGEDNLPPIIRQMEHERAAAAVIARRLRPGLARMSRGAPPARGDRADLHELAQLMLRQLRVANAILLPLARLRLTAREKAEIAREMQARLSRRAARAGSFDRAGGDGTPLRPDAPPANDTEHEALK